MAGLDDYRLHDNRHTHAWHLVSSGLSLEIVGRLLDHTRPLTTKRYAHLADDLLRAAAHPIERQETAKRKNAFGQLEALLRKAAERTIVACGPRSASYSTDSRQPNAKITSRMRGMYDQPENGLN